MSIRKILSMILCLIGLSVAGQNKWDLKRSVEYALENNISVKQSDILTKYAELQLKQNKGSQHPTANFSTSTGINYGRSIDPTTNQFTSSQLLFQGFNLNVGIEVFNWHRIKNNVLASRLELEASEADLEKTKNDIALNVATYYLQALLAKEQVKLAQVQMEQTRSQMQDTRKKVDAGALPELNALQLEGQYANDSANLIVAQTTADQNVLLLKALLNIDASVPFDIDVPPVETIPIEPIGELLPDIVFKLALNNQPAQKANALRYKSLQASLKSARALMYPSLSIGGGLGTNFSSPNRKITGVNFLGYKAADPLGPVIQVGTTNYGIQTPEIEFIQSKKSFGDIWTGWGTQVDNNFRQNIGLTISVPIANGGVARLGYQRAKLDLENIELTREQTDQKLKNDIYQAYYNGMAALQRFNANQRTLVTTQKVYDFAQKRYDLGLLSTFDLITSQNNLAKAKLDVVYSQFDYVFKLKVLEFYKGQGIRLE
jgi:outer membrane protein